METKGFTKTRTSRELTEETNKALLEIENAAYNEELEAKKEGISIEEYQERKRKEYRKRKIIPQKVTQENVQEKYGSLTRWVYDIMPAEFRGNNTIIKIFQEESLGQSFKDIWNYKIVIPRGLKKEELIIDSSQKIEFLEDLSRTDLNSFEISESRSVPEEVDKIGKLIYSLKEKEIPALETYNTSKELFVINVSDYLIRRILTEKLIEILIILNRYEI
jgi:uncharacterized membrane protein YkoI